MNLQCHHPESASQKWGLRLPLLPQTWRGGLHLSLLSVGSLAIACFATPNLAQTPTPTSQTTPPAVIINRPVLKVGSQGDAVSELQATLKLLGYYNGPIDGIYSESTANAVSQFQKAAGLTPDGIMGVTTWERLFPPTATTTPNVCVCQTSTSTPKPAETPSTSPQSASLPILQLGMQGDAVRGLQERLRAKGFLQSGADGIFGPQTQAAVKAAQTQYNLKPDGVVNAETWIVLLR